MFENDAEKFRCMLSLPVGVFPISAVLQWVITGIRCFFFLTMCRCGFCPRVMTYEERSPVRDGVRAEHSQQKKAGQSPSELHLHAEHAGCKGGGADLVNSDLLGVSDLQPLHGQSC